MENLQILYTTIARNKYVDIYSFFLLNFDVRASINITSNNKLHLVFINIYSTTYIDY